MIHDFHIHYVPVPHQLLGLCLLTNIQTGSKSNAQSDPLLQNVAFNYYSFFLYICIGSIGSSKP